MYSTENYPHREYKDTWYRYKYEIKNPHKLEKAINDLEKILDEVQDDDLKYELWEYFGKLVEQIQSIEYKPEIDEPNDDDDDCIPF